MIWDILDLVSLKALCVLVLGSVFLDLLWKVIEIFVFAENFICNLNLGKEILKHVLPFSLCITSSICTTEIVSLLSVSYK